MAVEAGDGQVEDRGIRVGSVQTGVVAERGFLVVTDDAADAREAEELLAVGVGGAARHGDIGERIPPGQAADRAPGFRGGDFGDRAGVHDEQVRPLPGGNFPEPGRGHPLSERLRFVLVDLAAERDEREGLHGDEV